MVSSVLILALASAAAALKLTSPTSSDVWTVGEKQTVTWDAVSSDQDSFNIYLSNMASYPSTTILLASDVQSSAGSATIDGSKLTAGDSFTINFTNGTETEQIYAQSNQFNITEGSSTSSSSSSSAASTATSATSTSSTGTAAPTLSTTLTSTASLAKVSSGSSSVATSANHVNGTGSSSSTATSSATGTGTDASSTASATASGSATGSSTASGTGASASATGTTTSGAGKIVAGWVGFVAVAAMAL